ncbi:hypothetical protein [Hymenobacter crusticola]|uniref:hypothetical protein n=1 Tax=Hymenobacter crusticola TaxID=1770526 RepID=UPI00117B7AA3|nr:hypothetical protein [Hymenobacter crusticola]
MRRTCTRAGTVPLVDRGWQRTQVIAKGNLGKVRQFFGCIVLAQGSDLRRAQCCSALRALIQVVAYADHKGDHH